MEERGRERDREREKEREREREKEREGWNRTVRVFPPSVRPPTSSESLAPPVVKEVRHRRCSHRNEVRTGAD